MLVVNLFGAPGAGKSTGAAYIFSKLKMAGINAELQVCCQVSTQMMKFLARSSTR